MPQPCHSCIIAAQVPRARLQTAYRGDLNDESAKEDMRYHVT